MTDILEIRVVKSNRKTLSFTIQPDATIVVKAPQRMSERQIQRFITEHKAWIEKHHALVKKRIQQSKRQGDYLFLGNSLTFHPGNFLSISVKEDKLLFPQALLFRKEKELSSWYVNQAKEIITQQVQSFAKEMKTEYTSITFSDTSSKWGSCMHDNRLQFSWCLVMAPLLVLNYVVIHELAHTMQKNHTRLFWAIVRNFNPSYRQQIKWLKDYGATLKIL